MPREKWLQEIRTDQRRAHAHAYLVEHGWHCMWCNDAYASIEGSKVPTMRLEMYIKGRAMLMVQTRVGGGVEVWRPVSNSIEWDDTFGAIETYLAVTEGHIVLRAEPSNG